MIARSRPILRPCTSCCQYDLAIGQEIPTVLAEHRTQAAYQACLSLDRCVHKAILVIVGQGSTIPPAVFALSKAYTKQSASLVLT
jgi:hypothetical protein